MKRWLWSSPCSPRSYNRAARHNVAPDPPAQLLGIEVLDHIVIGRGRYMSPNDQGVL